MQHDQTPELARAVAAAVRAAGLARLVAGRNEGRRALSRDAVAVQRAAFLARARASRDARARRGAPTISEPTDLADLAAAPLFGSGHDALAASVVRVPIGVNAPKIHQAEETGDYTYGDQDAILADLDESSREDALAGLISPAYSGLGAQFVRLCGPDLTWPQGSINGGRLYVPVCTSNAGEILTFSSGDAELGVDGLRLGTGDDATTFGTRMRTRLYWTLYREQWDAFRDFYLRIGPRTLEPSGGDADISPGITDAHPIQGAMTLLTIGALGNAHCVICDPLQQMIHDSVVHLEFATEHLGSGYMASDAPTIRWFDGTPMNIYDMALAPDSATLPAVDAGTYCLATVEEDVYSAPGRLTVVDPQESATMCGTAYNRVLGVGSEGTALDWVQKVLDPRCRYKLMYYYLIAKEMGQLLIDLQAAFDAEAPMSPDPFELFRPCGDGRAPNPWSQYCRATRVDLFASILGFGTGNELNNANLFYTDKEGVAPAPGNFATGPHRYAKSAGLWAWFAYASARGIADALDGYLGSRGRPLKIWLPSLATYRMRADDTAYANMDAITGTRTFADQIAWLYAHLSKLDGILGSTNLVSREYRTPTYDLRSLFVNLDYHYYHHKSNAAAGFIGRLPSEVAALREVLRRCGFRATVSICEIGASSIPEDLPVADASISEPLLSTIDDPYPYVSHAYWSQAYRQSSEEIRDAAARFQARDVWRRLGVAAACGVPLVAWHTRMGLTSCNHHVLEDDDSCGDTSGFSGTGLREDETTFSPITDASDAGTKLAWWVFQRFATLLGSPLAEGSSAGVVASIERIAPEPTGKDAGYDFLPTDDPRNLLLIVKFTSTRFADHVYLAFVDPCADVDARGASAPLRLTAANLRRGRVVQLRTVPDADWILPGPTSGVGYFPRDSISDEWNHVVREWDGDAAITLSGLISDADPILLLASEPLTFLPPVLE